MKESIAPGLEAAVDPLDKSNPFDKLIVNDQLTYLPNLYLRQFKLVEDLIHLRQDFPEQKVLLPRNNTVWDNLLDEMKQKSRTIVEVKKYKIAQKFHLARQARLQVQRQQLRKEEQYHYHRILSSCLAQSVVGHFQQQLSQAMEEERVEENEVVQKSNFVKKKQDGIFVDEDERDDYPYIPEENNLLDDLLNENIMEEKPQEEEVQNLIQIEPISTYAQRKYNREKEEIDQEPQCAISRKGSLRRINESVRKRLKIKEEEEEQLGRSLSSATVFLSNWLNLQTDPKCANTVELPNDIEWLFSSEKPRKKRDDDSFELRWSAEEQQRMDVRNEKFNIRKGKVDSNILTLSIKDDEEQYRKLFEKNVGGEKTFPPTLRNVKPFHTRPQKRYYNEFHDRDYELFIMKNNKRKILKQFADKASLIFPENYSHDELQQNQSINTGKIFVHPPHKVLDRIIYKISDYKLTVSVRNELKMPNLDLDRMVLMTYLIKKYLSEFGNAWKSITQFISMSEYFSNIFVTQELVQEVYQLISKYENQDNRLVQLELWDKKILPYNHYGSHSYVEFNESMYNSNNFNSLAEVNKIEAQEDTSQQNQNFDFDRYEETIDAPVRGPKSEHSQARDQFYRFSKNINKNVAKMHLNAENNHKSDEHKRLKTILAKFVPSDKVNPIDQQESNSLEMQKVHVHTQLSQSLKGEIKIGTPFRKKKNINERNNELVKILQALRNKNVTASNASVPKKPEEMSKPLSQINPIKAPIAPSMPPKQLQNQDPKKQLQKSPQKPDKKLGAPSKKDKDRKNKDQQEKK